MTATVPRATGRIGTAVPVVVTGLLLGGLVVRAAADVWRAPALRPQQLGTRALDVVTAPGGRVVEALTTSVLVAVVTVALAVLLGWSTARAIATDGARRHRLAIAVLAAPLLVSPFATGVGLTEWTLRLGLADSTTGLVAAHLTQVLPYVVVVLVPGFDADLRAREEVATAVGLRSLDRLRLVTLPGVRRELAAALLLGFLVSFSQYGTSLAVGAGRPTLPLLLVPFLGTDPQVAAALTLLFLVPALGMVALLAPRTGTRQK